MGSKAELLKTVKPFDSLPGEVLQGVAESLQETRYKKDTVIYQQELTKMKGVDIIAEGGYEAFYYDSTHHKRMQEQYVSGQCYGGISILLNRKRSLRTVIARKGTLVYTLPRKDFRNLCKAYDEFFRYFMSGFAARMQDDEFAHFFKRPNAFQESYIASEQLYSRRLDAIEHRDIVWCGEDTPVYEAAQKMAAARVSCIFVKDGANNITGYITDITLRDNVIARRFSPDVPAKDVMDNPIVAIDADAYIYEALLMMFQTKTRYLLIRKNNQYLGFISRNKLLSEQAQSPLVFIQSVKLALSADELRRKWEQVPGFVNQLLSRGVHAEIVNEVITTIADTIALKVIEGAIAEMGTPPSKFAFVVLGSEGRKEQTLKTDQDNAIIYEDKANEQREKVRKYFLKFSALVSKRLDFIGFSYCTGGYMAKNPKWTHSLSHWKRNYRRWMEESLPETVINFSTFFDCRCLYGDKTIVDDLNNFLDEELQKPMEKLFFYMAKNALQYEPPLTFFRNIRTTTIDSQEVFDIKKAMTPIVDLVRVYALKHRIFEQNTGKRLKALQEKGVISETEFHELMQSYYYLMGMRLKHQAMQISQDKVTPDNYIHVKNLTRIEQVTLKEIFKTIENFQGGIKVKFTNNLFG
ncbi:CBS domain-containing protein [Pedobacter sp. BS3]|uniref:DUF294 nucleotidyltransferase-like domain-containing protein n=1 Tax=Pedobacter sp. BS3 TaxID=2567937 RepID=UPI0011EEB35E|nr:DUF294 nucleotidyltransferase-like domain-containing protein [Pedobacter sp. BS3]TZF84729.1 CBS domain-containing protein [Pedobacter sp. BS3]